jgi:hypothetical protein
MPISAVRFARQLHHFAPRSRRLLDARFACSGHELERRTHRNRAAEKAYPHQDFVIMGEVGEVSRSDRVNVKIEAPGLNPPHQGRKPRKVVKAQPLTEAAVATATNVVSLRKEENA